MNSRVREILTWLERRGSKRNRDGMARYGIVAPRAFGVSMGTMQTLAKTVGRDHDLALDLWKTEWHEARSLCAFIDDPARVTPAQMDSWIRDFNNWAICDTVCFKLFDRTPHAWKKAVAWTTRRAEFERRAGYAPMASLALHDRAATDATFLPFLRVIERGATDERNFVKKAVSWALRGIGARTSGLHTAAIATARRLAASENASARWVGKDALRDLQRPLVKARIARRST